MMSKPTATEQPYFDEVVTRLMQFSIAWAAVAILVGVYVAAELVFPTMDFGQPWLSFGRLRPLHTDGIIFGFGVSALMGTAFYTVQRTSNVTLFAPKLAGSVAMVGKPSYCLAGYHYWRDGLRRKSMQSLNGHLT